MWRLIAVLGLGVTTLTPQPTYAAESFQETTKVLTSASVIAFAASADLTRTRQFYAGVLGLAVVEEDSTLLVLDAGGTQLRISKVDKPSVAPYTVLGWRVQNIGDAVTALRTKGVTFERFPGLPHDASGIATFGNGDRVAWFKDPDGHLLSLTQFAH